MRVSGSTVSCQSLIIPADGISWHYNWVENEAARRTDRREALTIAQTPAVACCWSSRWWSLKQVFISPRDTRKWSLVGFYFGPLAASNSSGINRYFIPTLVSADDLTTVRPIHIIYITLKEKEQYSFVGNNHMIVNVAITWLFDPSPTGWTCILINRIIGKRHFAFKG